MHSLTARLRFSAFFGVVFISTLFLSAAPGAHAATNLFANPSVETASGSAPASWATDVWGTTKATFTYPTGGAEDGTRYVKTQITTKGSGDAKWYPVHIAGVAGQSYTFSDWYQSTVVSDVQVEVLLKSGSYTYINLGAPAVSSTWKQFSATFTLPANTKTFTVLHFIQAVGTLSVDNYSVSTSGTVVAKPTIASFTATPASILAGNSTTLAWSVSPTSTLTITPNVGAVTGTSVSVSPTTTTTYTLTATDSAGTATKTAKVTVTLPAKPVINSFAATPASITAGTSTKLAWSVTGASTTLSITPGVGIVTGTSASVSPTTTVTYTLTAANAGGSATKTVKVTVTPPAPPAPKPTINSFSVSPTSIVDGNSATLSWSIADASSTSIDNGIGNVTGTSISVSPDATTTYTITATNPQGSVTAQTTLAVTPAVAPPPPPPGNLIPNPTFEATTTQGAGIVPLDWATSAWGAASSATFSYPVAGVDDNFAAQVSVPTYTASTTGQGAAEWYFNPVAVTGGDFYSFSDSYQSNATSFVIAQWALAGGTTEYDSVATLPSSGGAWKNASFYFNAPANAISLTILHQLQGVGNLTVDNYSLSAGTVPVGDQLARGVVTLAFDDGLLTQYDNALPILEAANMPASFYIISTPMNAVSSYDIFTDPGEDIAASTDGSGTTWSPIYVDPTEAHYNFSDTYTSASPSTVVATYTLNGTTTTQILAALPAGANARANIGFILPTKSGGKTVTPITIAHTGTALTATSPSLKEYGDGYMSESQVADLKAAGEEIGDHTETHPDLTSLTQAQATTEIAGDKSILENDSLGPVTTMAYPLGDYNQSIEAIAQAAGLVGGRTTDIGYNGKTTDPFALKTGNVDTDTSFATIKAWIDTAIAQKLWLTLTIHNVDSVANLNAIGDAYGTTPQILQQVVSYLGSKEQSGSVEVKTMSDALPLLQ